MKIKKQIDEIEKELQADKYQPYFDEEQNRYISFAEFVLMLDENYKQITFDIAESTGEGNYKPVEQWNFVEIKDYLKRKEKQLKIIRAKYKNI